MGEPLTVITTVAVPSNTGKFFIVGLLVWVAATDVVWVAEAAWEAVVV